MSPATANQERQAETFGVLGDATRVAMLSYLWRPRTIAQIAKSMGDSNPSRLYHHIHKMVSCGLVREVDVLPGNPPESVYQIVPRAERVVIDVLDPQTAEINIGVVGMVASSLVAMQQVTDERVHAMRLTVRVPDPEAARLIIQERRCQLVSDLEAIEVEDGVPIQILIAHYPLQS